jgi:hypothetical protein
MNAQNIQTMQESWAEQGSRLTSAVMALQDGKDLVDLSDDELDALAFRCEVLLQDRRCAEDDMKFLDGVPF